MITHENHAFQSIEKEKWKKELQTQEGNHRSERRNTAVFGMACLSTVVAKDLEFYNSAFSHLTLS